jgi:thiol-disulfide isomerase/thioredoxin
MSTALSLLALLIGGVFVTSAIAKIADRDGSRRAVMNFGLPTSVAGPLSSFLPFAELAIAFVLTLTTATWWGSVAALSLLLIFTIGITINLAKGRSFDCHCFGQLHSAPISLSTVVRNLLLVAAAAFVGWQAHNGLALSPVAWLGNWMSTYPAVAFEASLVGALIAGGWLILHLFRQNGRLLLRMDQLEVVINNSGLGQIQAASGLSIGSPAPSFELPRASGDLLSLDGMLEAGKPILLIFSDPKCAPCDALLPDIAHWEREYSDELAIALVSRDSKGSQSSKYELKNVLIQQNREVAEAFHAQATPSAVLIKADGSIGSNVVMGSQAIAELIAKATGTLAPIPLPVMPGTRHDHHSHSPSPSNSPTIGARAPFVSLPDLSGRTITLSDFTGRDTLVLFWNPRCSFCKEMLPTLKIWERDKPETSPELLIISVGTVEENRAMELRSTIILNQDFSTARTFGANATPSGVLVDARGMVASPLAIGAPAVLSLATADAEAALV